MNGAIVNAATYPLNDEEFQDAVIESVGADGSFTRSDGWSFCLPHGADVVVKQGMTARFYGRGIGYVVRGLFIDGVRVFYRTKEADDRHQLVERYGATPADWLARWGAGESVWSVEMGGLGPGYEQCIQITAAELLRHMLTIKYDVRKWTDTDHWKADTDAIKAFSFADPTITALGLSGAQFGAAFSLSTVIYRRGPIEALNDPVVKDRLILVSKHFPGAAP